MKVIQEDGGYLNTWGSVTSELTSWTCSWDKSDNHHGNWYLDDWTNSEVKLWEMCCANDYGNTMDKRSSDDGNRITCKHFSKTCSCTKSMKNVANSYNF